MRTAQGVGEIICQSECQNKSCVATQSLLLQEGEAADTSGRSRSRKRKRSRKDKKLGDSDGIIL